MENWSCKPTFGLKKKKINFIQLLDFLHWQSLYEPYFTCFFFLTEFTIKKGTYGGVYMRPSQYVYVTVKTQNSSKLVLTSQH
jgi:hypothetical protein